MVHRHDQRQDRPGRHGRGPSSFWMHDPEKVFAPLKLRPGDRILDLGCGPGDYSIRAAKVVGHSGLVYALDRERWAIERINEKLISEGCSNIRVVEADITHQLPLRDNLIDVCLMATVLHIMQIKRAGLLLFGEIHRVLKPGGRLAVIECKKEDQPFGPPKHIRLSPEEVQEAVRGHGFRRIDLTDLGYTYLIQFVAEEATVGHPPTGPPRPP